MWRRQSIFVTLVIYFAVAVSAVSAFTVDGNKVFIDDSNVYMAQEPHTLGSSGWVTNNLTSKHFSGNIDVYFGFDSSAALPVKAELYSPHEISETKSYNCDPPYWYNRTATHFWCWHNVTTTITDNQTGQNETVTTAYLVFDHDYETSNIGANTFSWTETHIEDYKNVADKFTKVNYNYNGKDTWYYAKNVPVQAGTEYSFRTYIQIQFNTQGKYDWCVKPSSETLSQAIANGHLYCLDPWWNMSYPYRYKILNSSRLNSTMPYYVNDNSGVGGKNILTRYGAGCTGVQYVYSTESGPSGTIAIANDSAECNWVDTSTGQGNNPQSVFPSLIIAYWPMENTTSSKIWDLTDGKHHGAITGSLGVTTGMVGNALVFDGTNDYATISASAEWNTGSSDKISILGSFKRTNAGEARQIISYRDGTPLWYTEVLGDDTFRWLSKSSSSGVRTISGGAIITNNEYSFALVRTPNPNTLYINATSKGTSSAGQTGVILDGGQDLHIGCEASGHGDRWAGNLDEMLLYDGEAGQGIVNQYHWNTIGNLTSLGAEEEPNTAPTVDLVSPADNTEINDNTPDIQFYLNDSDSGDVLQATVWIDGSPCGTNNSVTNGTLTTITSTCTLANGAYEWTIIANDSYDVAYPASNWTFHVDAWASYNESFYVPSGASKLMCTAMWTGLFDTSGVTVNLKDPSNVLYQEFGSNSTTRKKIMMTVIPLPGLLEYNITRYDGLTKMSVPSPAQGAWTLEVTYTDVMSFEAGVDIS